MHLQMLIKGYCLLVVVLAVVTGSYLAAAQMIPFEISPKAASSYWFGVAAVCFFNAVFIYKANKEKLDPLGWTDGRGTQGVRRVFLVILAMIVFIWFGSSIQAKGSFSFVEGEPPLLTVREVYLLDQNKGQRIQVDRQTFLIVGGSKIGLGWAAIIFMASLITRMGLDVGQAIQDETIS